MRKEKAFKTKGSRLYLIHLCLTDIWHTTVTFVIYRLTHSWLRLQKGTTPVYLPVYLQAHVCVCVCVCMWRVSALPSSLGPYGEEQQE